MIGRKFGNFYFKKSEVDSGYDIFEIAAGGDKKLNWEFDGIHAIADCQRRYIADLNKESDTLKGDMAALLDYVKAGQYGSGEDVSVQSSEGLALFNRVQGLMSEAIAGDMLGEEVARLTTREQRFIKQLDAMNKLMGELLKHDVGALASTILQAMEDSGGILEISPMLNPGTDWYHYTEDQALEMLSQAKLTEGGAAYLLGSDIIRVRVLMEQTYGASWRDMAATDGES